VTDLMSIAGTTNVGGRSVSEIADRFLEQSTLKGGALPRDALDVIKRFLSIAGDPGEAVARLRALAQDTKLNIAAAIDQFESRVGFMAARGIDTRKTRFSTSFGRGVDYYTGFEFELHARGNDVEPLVAGGRYDGLSEALGGPAAPGIGFAIGEDRLILSLQESGKGQTQQGRDVYIAWMGERAYAAAIRAARDLRNAGFSVELPPVEQKFGKALSQADKLGAKYALILGDNEVSEALWTLKTLSTGEQQKFPEPELIDFLRNQKSSS